MDEPIKLQKIRKENREGPAHYYETHLACVACLRKKSSGRGRATRPIEHDRTSSRERCLAIRYHQRARECSCPGLQTTEPPEMKKCQTDQGSQFVGCEKILLQSRLFELRNNLKSWFDRSAGYLCILLSLCDC